MISGLEWPRVLEMLQIPLFLATFIGYMAIVLALPFENNVKHAFVQGMYTAEVRIRPQLIYCEW